LSGRGRKHPETSGEGDTQGKRRKNRGVFTFLVKIFFLQRGDGCDYMNMAKIREGGKTMEKGKPDQ